MARNTGAMLLNQGGRTLLQGAYFVLLARALGVTDYGAFAATTALIALLAPFGSLGAINLMIRNVARDHSSAAQQYATAILVTLVASLGLTALLVAITPYTAPNGVTATVVLLIAAADLFGARLVEVAGGVFQAREQMMRTAIFPLILHGARLAGAGLLIAGPWEVSVLSWAVVYAATSAVVSAAVMAYTSAAVGRARASLGRYRAEWRDGLMFSVGLSAQTVYNDIDKAMLGRLGTLEATGVYTAAYRVVDTAFTPMRALLGAAYARFFRQGEHGLRSTLGFSRKIATPGLGYCLFASVALFAGADLVPVILGSSYQDAVGALRGLAVLPLLKGVHYLAADSLTGAGLQGLRTVFQIGVAVLNVGLNLWLIPAYSWQGAVAASIVCDGVLAVGLWATVVHRLRSQRAV